MALGNLVVATGDERAAADVAHGLHPLSERILVRFPGPRALWILAWATVPWLLLDTGERSAIWEQSRVVVVLNYTALSFAVVVTLLGAERIARRYAEAYAPLREERTLEVLDRQHTLLGAADALEKRVRAIHEWPVSEATWAWLIGLPTSVVAISCARLILRLLGF